MVAGQTHATIQEAVDASCASGDVVWVNPGTYYETVTIQHPVELRGVGSAESVIVDASSCTGADCPVLTVTANNVTVANLTLQGGYRLDGSGGGIAAALTQDLLITGCIVSGNSAYNGGGLFVAGGQVVGSLIEGNTARSYGGGIWIDNYSAQPLSIVQNTIQDNTAAFGGGGYQYFQADVDWTDNTIVNNTAFLGGGLFLHGVEPATKGNSVSGNTASATSWGLDCYGGGVWDEQTDWESAGDTISGNFPDDSCP